MTKHKKLKMRTPKDEGLDSREKAEMVFMAFFCLLLGSAILAFIIASLEVLNGCVK